MCFYGLIHLGKALFYILEAANPTQMRDIVIVGGGLAGLCSAIHLSQSGLDVLLVEKRSYPRHKVCGEYISNEVIPYLKSLGANPQVLNPINISRFVLNAPNGQQLETILPLGGFSISRYSFDYFLYQKALASGAKFILNTFVDNLSFKEDHFELALSNGQKLNARLVIGAFGKRANLDRVLERPFFRKRSPFIGVKYHVEMDYPQDQVGLYNFDQGYCGLSRVEGNQVNVCYLTTRKQLKKYGTISAMQERLFAGHYDLRRVISEARHLMSKPLVINEISFEARGPIHNHMLMTGDAAGLITPLCGNGMAMAIGSARMLAPKIIRFFNNEITRLELAEMYKSAWIKNFSKRLWFGRKIQSVFLSPTLCNASVFMLKYFPFMTRQIIKQTHGTPFLPRTQSP